MKPKSAGFMSLALPSASLRSLTFNYLSSVMIKLLMRSSRGEVQRLKAHQTILHLPSPLISFSFFFFLLFVLLFHFLFIMVPPWILLPSPLYFFFLFLASVLLLLHSFFCFYLLFCSEHQITLSEALFDFLALRAFILNMDPILSVISHFLPSSSSPDKACL